MTFIIQKLLPFYLIDKHLPENTKSQKQTANERNFGWENSFCLNIDLPSHMTATRFDTPVQVLTKEAPEGDLGTLMQVPLRITSLATILFYDTEQVVDLYIRNLHVGATSMKIEAKVALYHMHNFFF